MLFVRLHLDDCDQENGAMEIALGSHRAGYVTAAGAAQIARQHVVETTNARRGDVLVMDMLMLHRSRPSKDPRPRRTLRVDFAGEVLPSELGWAMTAD
jgi:hypothetical protein